MASVPATRLTEVQYLAMERAAEFKSEFYRGEMFAMAGGTANHSRIEVNLQSELRAGLKGRGCEVFTSTVRVKVSQTGLYTYPDICIVCGPLAFLDQKKDTIVNPSVLVEILSPSTEANDRGRKFRHYQTIPSLKEYVLVLQAERRVEQFCAQRR